MVKKSRQRNINIWSQVMHNCMMYNYVVAIAVFIICFFSYSDSIFASKVVTEEEVVDYFLDQVDKSWPSGKCLNFVRTCFQKLGGTRSSSCCAYDYGNSHIQSTDMTNIPLGADVFFGTCGGGPCDECGANCYGHIGVYVGKGYFVNATGGKVQKLKISDWKNHWRGWGDHGGITIQHKSDFKISATTSNPKNDSVTFNVDFSPKARVKEIHIIYGKNEDILKNIQDGHKNGDGYDHKLLWKNTSGDVKESYSFNTINETANHYYISLKPGTTYYYKICVKLGDGKYYITDRKKANRFTTKADRPSNVTNLVLDHANRRYAEGEQLTASWKVAKQAKNYKVSIFDSNNSLVGKVKTCTNTTCKMTAPSTPGTYSVQVIACNEAGDSATVKMNFAVMKNLTVTFAYNDDGITADLVRYVKYNGSLTTPVMPSRTGYSFRGWASGSKTIGANSSITGITGDVVYTADWRANKYSVKIVDGVTNNQIGSNIILDYGTELNVKQYVNNNGLEIPEHPGYKHTGYSSDIYTVTSDTEQLVYAMYRWESLNKLTTEITNVVRAREKSDLTISDGYSIDIKVTAPGISNNGTNQPIKGRVVVALKTDAGRLLIETESATFVLYPKTTSVSKSINVFVPYEADADKLPTRVEAFVVNNYYSAGIISDVAYDKNLVSAANATLTSAGWLQSTEKITHVGQTLSNGDIVAQIDANEDQNEYLKTTITYKTALGNGEPNYVWYSEQWKSLDSGTRTYVKNWPKIGSSMGCGFVDNSLYKKYHVDPVKPVTYDTRRVTSSETLVGYIYYHWCRGLDNGDLNHAVKSTYKTTCEGKYVYKKFESFYSEDNLPKETYNDVSYFCAKNHSQKNYSKDSYYWYRLPVYKQTWKEEYKITTWKKTETSVITANQEPEGAVSVKPTTYQINGLVNNSTVHYFTEGSKELNYTIGTSYTLKMRKYAYKPSRYVAHHEDMNIQDSMSVDVGTEHAGESAVVYIYKDRQAADYTTEYIEAVTVDDKGLIHITGASGGALQTREDISFLTGDYTVAVALYGETNARVVAKIEVPDEKKPVYRVDFQAEIPRLGTDEEGNETIIMETVNIDSQEVREGHNAEYPDEALIPEKEGYHFTGWSESLNNIRGDVVIKAQYAINEYSVVFVNWETQQVIQEKRNHGDAVAAPELPEPPEGLDVHWVVLGNESNIQETLQQYESDGKLVTGDMVVAAEYFTKIVDLTVVHFEEALQDHDMTTEQQEIILQETSDMNLDTINSLESNQKYPTTTESMRYSDIIQLTEYENAYDENIVFVGWKNAANDKELLKNAEITDDMTIYPVYRFADTVDTPVADVPSGEYDSEQVITLTCGTENAVIFYTMDGTDPAKSDTRIEYQEPFTIEKSCTLRACAMALGMNNSEIMEEIYAINAGDGIEYHIVTIYSNLAEDIDGYIYRERVRDGAKLDISGLEEIEHYVFGGLYYDMDYTDEFLTDIETVTDTLDLYAKFDPMQLTVVFKDDEGTIYSEQQVDYEGTVTVPDSPEKEGYIFVGWDPEVTEPIWEDTTFLACFVAENEYATVKLNRTKISSIVGGTIQLKAKVLPEELADQELVWTSDDESIAEVDENGKVTFVGEGTTQIHVMVVSSREKATCKAVVTKSSDSSIVLARNSVLEIDSLGYIRRVVPGENTVAKIRDQFVNDILEFYGPTGEELADDNLVGTGTLIRLADGENILDEAIVVMTGDIDGDGKIQNQDASIVSEIVAMDYAHEDYQGIAADVNGDGFVNNVDSSVITKYLVGKMNIT